MHTGKDGIPPKNQSITQQKIQTWWNLRHLTFAFPPMFRGHVHEWCSISSDSVRCSLCGAVHICGCSQNIIACNIKLQDNSSTVCTYTGIVLKSSSLFDPETSISEYNAGSITQNGLTRTPAYDKRAPIFSQHDQKSDFYVIFFAASAPRSEPRAPAIQSQSRADFHHTLSQEKNFDWTETYWNQSNYVAMAGQHIANQLTFTRFLLCSTLTIYNA